MGIRGSSYLLQLGTNDAMTYYNGGNAGYNSIEAEVLARKAVDDFFMKDFQDLGGKNNPTFYRGYPTAVTGVNGNYNAGEIYNNLSTPPGKGTGTNAARVLVCRDAGEAGGNVGNLITSYTAGYWYQQFIRISKITTTSMTFTYNGSYTPGQYITFWVPISGNYTQLKFYPIGSRNTPGYQLDVNIPSRAIAATQGTGFNSDILQSMLTALQGVLDFRVSTTSSRVGVNFTINNIPTGSYVDLGAGLMGSPSVPLPPPVTSTSFLGFGESEITAAQMWPRSMFILDGGDFTLGNTGNGNQKLALDQVNSSDSTGINLSTPSSLADPRIYLPGRGANDDNWS